jgi:drug/metabolite transporter superfamily protein YnfA
MSTLLLLSLSSSAISKDNENLNLKSTIYEQEKYRNVGITFSTVGGIFIVSSIPFYAKANHYASELEDISAAICIIVGTISLGTGLVLEGVSIPFYLKSNKIKKENKISLFIGIDKISVNYDF